METQHSWLVLIVTSNLSSVNHLGTPRRCPELDSPIFVLPICLSFCFSRTRRVATKSDSGGVGTQGHTCPGSGTVLAPDLSWLLFCELSSIWERNEHTGELVCQKSPKQLPKDYWSLFMRTTSQHPSIFSAFWNTIIKVQNTDIGSPLIIPFFPSSFSVGNSIFSNVKTLKYSLLGFLLVFRQEIMVIYVNLINY